jgi:transcriptional regulator with XRE-family HTH domain
MTDIGDTLTGFMKKHKISDEEMALKVGVRALAIIRWRNGRHYPSGRSLLKLVQEYPKLGIMLKQKGYE